MAREKQTMTAMKVRNPAYAERVRDSFARQPFMTTIGARLTAIEPGFCEIRVAARPDLMQQHGFMHGGITGAIADSAGGYASYSMMPADATVLTIEYKINFMNPAVGEEFIARARVRKAGRTIVVTGAEVFALTGAEERPIADMLGSFLCLVGKPDNAALKRPDRGA